MALAKKKILVFVDWFYPGYKGGGPIRSCINMVTLLQEVYDVKVITRDTDLGGNIPYKGIVSNQWTISDLQVNTMYLSSGHLSFAVIKNIIREEQPDHVYLNGMYSIYFTIFPLLAKRFITARPVFTVAPRGMLYESAIRKKAFKKKLFFALLKKLVFGRDTRFHVTNEKEAVSVKKYFPHHQLLLADNLPAQYQPLLQTCTKEAGSLRCVFIARIDRIKNLLLLLEIIRDLSATLHLTIAGPVDDKVYWEDCKKVISDLPSCISVQVTGAVSHESIQELLSQAHLFVLLTQGENFGHAIFESFLAGRPVLISDQTPWRRLEAQKAGWDLPLDDIPRIAGKFKTAISWDQETFNAWSRAAWDFGASFLRNNRTKDNYFKIFQ